MRNILLIGLGAMGKNHLRVLKELGHNPIICDLDKVSLETLGLKYNVKTYQFYDNALDLERDNIDLVIVATPTPTHYKIANYFLNNGKHVLLEKPITALVEDGEKLISIASLNKKLLGVGYIETFNPAFQNLLSLIRNDYLGTLTSINMKRVGGIPRSANNIIFDLMTHDIGLLLDIFGKEPDSISVNKHTFFDNKTIDSAQALLLFGNTTVSCEANWISPIKMRRITVTGTKGYCEVDLIEQTLTWHGKGCFSIDGLLDKLVGEIHTFKFNQEPLKEELRSFINAVENFPNVIFPVTGEKALQILDLTSRIASN